VALVTRIIADALAEGRQEGPAALVTRKEEPEFQPEPQPEPQPQPPAAEPPAAEPPAAEPPAPVVVTDGEPEIAEEKAEESAEESV
jgi:hypothetical protein